MKNDGYRGNVEILSGRYVRGWCASRSGETCNVHVFVNGKHVMSLAALKPRRDLRERGFCADGGGFEFDISGLLSADDALVELCDPDGNVLPGGEGRLSYATAIFGDTLPHSPRLNKSRIGIHGNFYLATSPVVGSVLGKILTLLGTHNVNESDGSEICNIWFHHPHHSKPRGISRFINGECSNIAKSHIDLVHEQVFGRSVCIEPSDVNAEMDYVVKSEDNAAHDGKVFKGKDISPESLSGKVVQRVVDNRVDGNSVYDIRVPVVGNAIPFVYIKTRSESIRFSNANRTATITSTSNYLSESEVAQILVFCRNLGLDYGELDILRDGASGEIFVVDVNNTPSGPPNGLTSNEVMFALRELSWAFATEFIRPGNYWNRPKF